jgi:hypothetical protein
MKGSRDGHGDNGFCASCLHVFGLRSFSFLLLLTKNPHRSVDSAVQNLRNGHFPHSITSIIFMYYWVNFVRPSMQSVTKGQCSPSIHAVKAELLFCSIYILCPSTYTPTEAGRVKFLSLGGNTRLRNYRGQVRPIRSLVRPRAKGSMRVRQVFYW